MIPSAYCFDRVSRTRFKEGNPRWSLADLLSSGQRPKTLGKQSQWRLQAKVLKRGEQYRELTLGICKGITSRFWQSIDQQTCVKKHQWPREKISERLKVIVPS